MLRYIVRRVLYAFPILLGVAILTYVLFYATVTPEQMARRNLSARNPTKQQLQAWLVEHGYDKPPAEQFRKHVQELFLFRFGKSDTTGEDIWQRVRQGALPSFHVASIVFLSALVASISVALFAAYFRGTYVDYWLTFLCVLNMSVVYMVYIIVMQYLLGKVLLYFPLAGYRGGLTAWKFVLLPAVVGVIAGLGSSVRLYRTFMLDEMNQDYVRTARAKGVRERAVLFGHVLKNAAIPILTSVVLSIPFLITGSLLLESFFGIPGLGSFLFDGIQSQDFAVVRAMVFIVTVLYILGNIMTDVSYAIVDPRVRFE